jgi:hypothetical protein
MKKTTLHTARALLQTLAFTGLSDEQSLLATLVSQNPGTDKRVRQRAQSLLLLNDGATATEVSTSLALSRRCLRELIQRLRIHGLCAALLGAHASRARRAWLALSPCSIPHVHLQTHSVWTRSSSRASSPGAGYTRAAHACV